MAMTKELRLTEIQGRGRSLVAAQPLKGGQIILRDSPILLYSALPLLTPSPSPYCDHCFKTLHPQNAAVSLCPSCSHHRFCSPTCLSAAHSSSHSPFVCHSLSKLRNCPSPLSSQPPDRQVQARFLIAAYNLAAVSPASFQVLLSLQGEPRDSEEAQFLHSLISTLCPPPQQQQVFMVEITAALLAKDKLNAFGLMEPPSELGLRSSRAYGVYPKASFFNHDCLPNACRFDYVDEANTDIVVRMIHDVPAGREVCLSYFPVNEPFSRRQRTLAEDYGFVCKCDRCNVEANWSDNEEAEEEGDGSAEGMDEDQDQEMEGDSESEAGCDIVDGAQGEADFPHAYFFVRFMCSRTNCWGTLAPLPPKDDGTSSGVMECNVCGSVKKDEEISGHGQNGLGLEG
ncbi:histone-lysine N-methyltransferase ASHR2 [Argentina anserina]|uniref:histone-lysine N-methyltransferase ASHR2 n=1 Tax=Argentina anserina TaxID=57926 RepID=UPI002176924D|nr:histone-lysine N-methyltransferase ASHR2 [Potentilla anserina]